MTPHSRIDAIISHSYVNNVIMQLSTFSLFIQKGINPTSVSWNVFDIPLLDKLRYPLNKSAI